MQPEKINNKEDYDNFRIDFKIINSGNVVLKVTRYIIYLVDLENHKYKSKTEEIQSQIISPGKPCRPFLTGISKNTIKAHNYFILIVGYINQKTKKSGIKYFFTKTIKSKIYSQAYSSNLSFVNKKEGQQLLNLLKYLIDEEIEKNEDLKYILNEK